MAQAGADGHPSIDPRMRARARIIAIRRRLEEINTGLSAYADETEELIQEVRALEASLEEQPRRHLRLLPPLGVVGAGVSAGAEWASRHGRSVSAGAVTVGVAGILAVALLARGSAAPHARGGPTTPTTPRGVPTASPTPGGSTSPPRAVPGPSHPPFVPPFVPVVVPFRVRRSAAASAAAQPPAGTHPAPPRPAPTAPISSTPTPIRTPTPQPSPCPIGLTLRTTAFGLSICI